MPAVRDGIMRKLYAGDVWSGFKPSVDPETVEGWNGNHPSLSQLASTPGSKVVIDVGVWKGQSTINMALAMKNAGIDGCVVAVDTFLGSPEHWAPQRNLFERKNGLPNIYDIFMANAFKAGVTDYVVPMPQTSANAAVVLARYQVLASVIHVDAAHEYEEVLSDARAYWKLLADGGCLIGDDYHPSWPGVVRAATEFGVEVQRPVKIERPKWIVAK